MKTFESLSLRSRRNNFLLKVIFSSILLLSFSQTHSQTTITVDSLFWVIVEHEDALPVEDGVPVTRNQELNDLFRSANVEIYHEAFPQAKSNLLQKVYEVVCNGCQIDSLIANMASEFPLYFSEFKTHEYMEIAMYDPEDYMWYLTTENPTGWLWHLDKIMADDAWDITLGSSDILVAILDTHFDITHPDLESKFILDHDPYTGQQWTCNSAHPHGTAVASFVGAETTETGQTNTGGQLASVGFKTMMVGYNAWSGSYLQKAYHASTVMGADIITSSAGGWSSCPDGSGIDAAVVKEILDNGTAIIMPAGNGDNGTHNFCSSIDPVNHTAFFPLSPYYDDRIILVTSTNKDDEHGMGAATHSHYPMVDLCAPGYDVMGAFTTDCGDNEWPYWDGWGGTSFSTPITAGTAALVLSVNPCLEPSDLETILKATTDPVVDAANYPDGLGTGRINAYQAVLMAQEYGDHEPITVNTLWNTETFVQGELVIESGATLTISGNVKLAADAKIIVKQNGRLIIDGGHLTNSKGCGDQFWRGIELWGTTGATQAIVGGVRQHGYLQIKNGGVIENAREGVSNWKSGDWNAIGGVIDARDGEFRNCRRAVAFYKHQNVHPFSGNPVPNLSKFSRTKFITDDDYLGDLDTDYPFAQVTLWGVDGVTFSGCEFKNTSSVSESKKRSKGIYSEDAHYKVLSACASIPGISGCPEEDVIPTVFDGYYRAIEAAKVTDALPILVNGAEFKNNMVGVELADLAFSEIIFSEFELGGHPHAKPYGFPDYTDNVGVYSNGTQCFVIEENYFQKDPNAVSSMQNGVLIYQSDANSNNVYRNTFSDLDHAAIGFQVNRNTEGYIGLHFMCNEMSSNLKDFVVARQNGFDFLASGIRESQGSLNPLIAAGNEFSAPNGIPNEYTHWDINSEFNYHYHHGPGESFDPNEVTPNKIFAVQVPNGQSCPTNYQSGKTPALNTVISEFNQKKNDYYNLLYAYKQLIDDGDTEGTLDDIVATWPSEAWELHDRLMARSPYNSDTVLIAAAAREIMPHAMLLEVLLANPDALRKGTVIKYVSTQLTNPLPSYMIDILRASLDQRTLRTTMQNTLADHHSQMSRNYNFIIQHYTSDSLNGVNNDSLIYWLEQMDSPTGKYNLAGRLMSNGSNTLALNILDSIPLNFKLSRAQTEEWGTLRAFFEVIDGAMRNNRNIASLDSTELVQLEVLATNPNGGIGALRARKALCFFYENCLDAPFVPETRSHSVDKPLPPLEELLSELNEVKVFPNPAREYLTFSYSFFKEDAVRELNVYDQSGAQIKTFQLQNQQGQQLWDTRKIPSGIYFYDIREEGSKINSGKIVIQ